MANSSKKSLATRVRLFLTTELWDVDLRSLPAPRAFFARIVKVAYMVWQGFRQNQCPLHASALTYTTLVSIVPIIALALSVLRGLGAGEVAEQSILRATAAMPQEFQVFVRDILEYVNNTSFTALGGIGLLFLLLVVVQMLGQVEMALNRVWGVHVPRRFLRKFSDYLSVLVIVPVLVLAVATLNASMASTTFLEFLRQRLKAAADLYVQIMHFAPLMGAWVAFGVLYKFMPNTYVRFWPAAVSGIMGGSMWVGWQWLYITFQIGVANYNKIYATFASVFIFLLWVYVSWQIVLLGAEIGFALQNHATYSLERRSHDASIQSRITLALSVLADAAEAMSQGLPPLNLAEYSTRRLVPVRFLSEVVSSLVSAGYLGELAESPESYALLVAPERITIRDVVKVFLDAGAAPHALGLDRMNPSAFRLVNEIEETLAKTLSKNTVADLARARREQLLAAQ